jgi:hypothetical protein
MWLSERLTKRQKNLLSNRSKKLKEVADWLAPFYQLWEQPFDRLDEYLAKPQKTKH